MNPDLVDRLLLRLGLLQMPPIMSLTAAFVLQCFTTRGSTDCSELLDIACKTVEHWAAVFLQYDHPGVGWICSSDLHAALRTCGFPVRGRLLRHLRATYTHFGCVSYDGFIQACALIGSLER